MKIHRLCYGFIPLFLVLFLAGTAFGQSTNHCTPDVAWVPYGDGLPGTTELSTEMNGELYVLHGMKKDLIGSATVGISKWDGAEWRLITVFSVKGVGTAPIDFSVFKSYDGMLFLGGRFESFNNDPGMYGLVKWDGSEWSSARGKFRIAYVHGMEVHNGDLVGLIQFLYGNQHAMKWTGNDWEYLNDPLEPIPSKLSPCSMVIYGGTIYVGGTGAMNKGEKASMQFLKLDGRKWVSLMTSYNAISLEQLFLCNGRLYASMIGNAGQRYRYIELWDGTFWTHRTILRSDITRASFTCVDGNIYMLSGKSYNFTDLYWFDYGNFRRLSNTNGTLNMLGSYKGGLFLGGNFTGSCGTPLRNIARLCTQEICGRITGTVYHDANGNCVQDQGEQGLAGRMVRIGPGERYAATDREGRYFRYVENGTYSLSLQPYNYWGHTCPAPAETREATVTDGRNANGIDLGTIPVVTVQDLRVSMVADRARQGRPLAYVITYENAGTVVMNGTVHLSHDPILSFSSAQPVQSRYSPVLAEWDFTDLGIGESRTITVWTDVPVGVPNGANICSRVWITPKNIDVASNDDRDSVCVPVTGSYDPNDIQVTPLGIEQNGVIKPRDSVLTYWVRFQNTGNDTAFRVMVADTLSPHLDISSIRLGASSHPFSFSIDTSNVLVWTFNDILLPDSNASEPNSHGFFKYSVKLRRDLPALTEIANQAHIYFDYNAPVATNTVVSVLDAPMNAERDVARQTVAIHPNPARERIMIAARMHPGATIEIRNLLGETVKRHRCDGDTEISIDVRGLPAGNYLVVAETSEGTLARHITVIR